MVIDLKINERIIVEEYLNNWFTYDELAQYLCISVEIIDNILNNEELICNIYKSKNKKKKIDLHKYFIDLYNSNPSYEKEELTDKEKNILLIADYIIQNKSSIRITANQFNIGKTTLFDWLNENLPYISINKYRQVFLILMENKTTGIYSTAIQKQVLMCYDLLLSGYSSSQIQSSLNLSRNVVQRNLTNRLKMIDSKKYTQAKEILENNQMSNIRNNQFGHKK